MLTNTPVELIPFGARHIYLKRDDLLHVDFSGNKARKFAYFLEHDFPDVIKLIGYGSPQANSLYSMSALAKLKGWQLDFYVDHISSQVQLSLVGNYAQSIKNGANVIALDSLASQYKTTHEYIVKIALPQENRALFVPEGGRCNYAEFGVAKLALEIALWAEQNNTCSLKVFLPSGTGTTALFLNKYFVEHDLDIRVLTCAVVGNHDYLVSQFTELCADEYCHPEIVSLPRKYHFGKLYLECYQIWLQICLKSGVEFELLYDPVGFIALQQYLQIHPNASIMYIHQGGLLGNKTMLPRYQRKYPNV